MRIKHCVITAVVIVANMHQFPRNIRTAFVTLILVADGKKLFGGS